MGSAAPGLGLHANGIDASGGRVAGAHRTLQHGHLQCGHWHAGVVISEGRLKVVVVVLQAGTRMRACLSPAARTGQPLWRRLRAGHRSTTGPRVRGITKPPPVLSIHLSWCCFVRACRRSGSRIRDELRGQCREELHLHHRALQRRVGCRPWLLSLTSFSPEADCRMS